MSRGFKKDLLATELAYATKNLMDEKRRSFVSLPKVIEGECTEPQPHLILYGEKDKGVVRAEIFRLNRLENDGVNRCWKCKRPVAEYPTDLDEMLGNTPQGDWDHIRNSPGTRCDCESNGRVSCRACHSERHLQVKFGKKKLDTPHEML